MKSQDNQYLARKVMQHIRNNVGVDADVAKQLNERPQIDYIRSLVNLGDLEPILKLSSSPAREVRWLGLNLLRPLEKDDRVREFLSVQWEQSDNYDDRMGLMWRLLDYPDLEPSMHDSIYAFIRNNRDRWLIDATKFHGGADAVLINIRTRLSDPSFPESKKWVYLCVSLAAPDKEAVRDLLSSYINSDVPFVSKVAAGLLGGLQ